MGELKSSYAWRRMAAALGSALCAWVAVDALLASGAMSGRAMDHAFFWSWGAPFAAASVYLGWLLVSGHRPGSWKRAGVGCLGAALSGGAAFGVLFFARTMSGFGVLNGVAEGLRWSPAVATVGLMVTVLVGAKRGRRPRGRRPPGS